MNTEWLAGIAHLIDVTIDGDNGNPEPVRIGLGEFRNVIGDFAIGESFVTIVEMVLEAYIPFLFEQLGIFIPLIVVNCLILGRAEAFASKNNIVSSIVDALGMGIGFTIALTLLGAGREILGSGSLFDFRFVSEDANTFILFILPPGAFIALAYLTYLFNRITAKTN